MYVWRYVCRHIGLRVCVHSCIINFFFCCCLAIRIYVYIYVYIEEMNCLFLGGESHS